MPFVDLDSSFYKLVADFDRRFPEGVPSRGRRRSLTVHGDWTFGRGSPSSGTPSWRLPRGAPGRIDAGSAE